MGIILRQGIKNNIITYTGVLIGFLNILVLQPIVLQPDELGLMRLLFSVSTLFASIFPLGLNIFTIKYFPYFKDAHSGHRGYPGFLIISSTFLFLIGSSVFWIFKSNFLAHYSHSSLFIEEFIYLFPMSYFIGLFTIFTAYSSALFKTTVPSFLNEILSRIIIIAAIALYYLRMINFNQLVIIYVFSYLLILIVLLIYLARADKLRFRFNWSSLKIVPGKEAIRFTAIMCITSLASISLRNIDAVFIGSYKGLSDVAVYTIAITICSMIDVPGNALAKIVIPKIAEAFKNNDLDYIRKVYYKSNRVTVIAGALLFLLLFVNANALLSFLPDKYSEGTWVIKIIAIGGLVNMATGLNINIIQYSPHYLVGSIAFIGLALLSALSNLILIPAYGLEGAAMSTALSIVVVNIFTVAFINKKYGMQPIRALDIGILLSALLLGFLDHFVPIIPNAILSIFGKSSVILILFVIPMYKFNLIPELKELMQTRKLK